MSRSTSLVDDFQRAQFVTWFNDEFARTGLSKTHLARVLGQDSTAHVNKILAGKLMPTPQTLRKLCDAMQTSWAGAFAIAGYFGELLEALVDLVNLGTRWAEEDGAALRDFRSLGIIRLGERNPFEIFAEQPTLALRYLVASWKEVELESTIVTTDQNGEPLSQEVIEQLKAFSAEPRRPYFIVVPKPIAVALIVAGAGFPRRGDVYKDGYSSYAAELLIDSTTMIAMAQAHAKYRRKLPAVLEAARRVLADRSVPFDSRRPIAAEYVVAWADGICAPFIHYVRLAAYELFGEVGSSLATMTPYVELPQIRKALLPDRAQLTASEVATSND